MLSPYNRAQPGLSILATDYTRVAPESPGDFFDGGEIDQLLVLNILGLTDDEKREVRAGDPRAREVLERTEAMTPDELMRLNGVLRTSVWDELERPGPESVLIDGIEVRRGTRVRMHPADRRDILSAAIDGRTGVVESIEELMEGGVRLAVSPHDDPGRDLGPARPGHRFFFTADEVEPLARVLVAGIGNMFLGDDGFGCAVVQRLLDEPMPAGVDVVDYGIRGFDLAYALASGYESALLIDAAPLGEPAGTLAVIHAPADDGGEPEIDTHGMEPTRVLRLARELGSTPGRVLVLACQPAQLVDAGELSPPVRAAVETALPEVRRLVEKLLNDEREGGA